jgi:hypothetical protein
MGAMRAQRAAEIVEASGTGEEQFPSLAVELAMI